MIDDEALILLLSCWNNFWLCSKSCRIRSKCLIVASMACHDLTPIYLPSCISHDWASWVPWCGQAELLSQSAHRPAFSPLHPTSWVLPCDAMLVFLTVPVCLRLGSWNIESIDWMALTINIYFLQYWSLGSPRSRCQWIQFPIGSPLPALQTAVFWLPPPRWRELRALPLSLKALIPLRQPHPSDLIY